MPRKGIEEISPASKSHAVLLLDSDSAVCSSNPHS